MKDKLIISPSILSADFLRMGEQLASLDNSGADWIHLDVMDGHFVPNLSFGPLIVETCRKATKLPLDVHLMISNPDEFLEAYAKSGADIITVHVETCPHLVRSLQKIKDFGCKAGVALNPATSLHVLEWVLEQVDLVLLLATNPGFSGQKYLPQTTAKIAGLHDMIQAADSQVMIQVDGGINSETIPDVIAAGATSVVAGNAVFKHPGGISAGIHSLREVCRSVPA